MNDSTPLPKVQMLIISAMQGILLYALYSAFDNNMWQGLRPFSCCSPFTRAGRRNRLVSSQSPAYQ